MTESEFPGVQQLARKIAGAFAAIQFISEDRMAEVMQMNPNLMGPAAVQDAFNEAFDVAGTEHTIFRFR